MRFVCLIIDLKVLGVKGSGFISKHQAQAPFDSSGTAAVGARLPIARTLQLLGLKGFENSLRVLVAEFISPKKCTLSVLWWVRVSQNV